MCRQPQWKTVLWVALSALTVSLLLVPATKSWIERNRIDTVLFRNACEIRSALFRFHEDHGGRLPESIVDLIPNYIDVDKVAWLLPPEGNSDLLTTISIDDLRKQVQSGGLFEYLGAKGAGIGIIAYERGSLNSGEVPLIGHSVLRRRSGVYAISSDFRVVRVSEKELRESLRAGLESAVAHPSNEVRNSEE
jgi:hypothetical protein